MKYPIIMVNQQFAIENCPFSSLIYPLKMVIFHSYVSLPEGKMDDLRVPPFLETPHMDWLE